MAWVSLPEYPFVRHTQGRRFEARRRDAVVSLDAAPTLDARRGIERIAEEVAAVLAAQETVAVAAVARATDLARQLRDAATALGGAGTSPPRQQRAPPSEDRRALEGYVAAVRAAEKEWTEARAREHRVAARVVAGHVEDGAVVVEVKMPAAVRRVRKKKSQVSQQ